MTQQFNRGQLLDKAFKGEIAKGTEFTRVKSGCKIVFDGEKFRWGSTNSIVEMGIHCGSDELFEKHEEKHTIELTQLEINSLRVLVGDSSVNTLQSKKKFYSHPFGIIEGGSEYKVLFDKLEKLVK
ncbi:hypothetical protein FT641_27090 [Bacillus paranthracis]|uniref:hypothetical protein n=1 Tax=Bacillus paranthracis TaxID=2026186 RepID=UPI0018796AEE|nr:hypothetical protein [Bacillus paranthracis]MBE7117319.1 hypothetical protein [Bacillus paranthracis]MBE7134933.1 hypothetical protein [Bacillus paranthracis]MBE7156342.1 hypothetical protein [Bacillus paranthracis]